MQNRFTVKDFFYMLIGVVACVLIFLSITATNREAENVARVDDNLSNQHATLSSLNESIKAQQSAINELRDAVQDLEISGGGIDPAVLERILGQMSQSAAANPDAPGTSGSPTTVAAGDFQPGYNPRNTNPIHTDTQNNEGRPQEWQVAPDADLPEDFAPGDELIYVWPSDAQKLVPLVATDAYSRRVFWYTLEYLVNFNLDAPFPYTPGLARAWQVTDEGMTLTFHINEKARWWDGTPVTAEDVVFTWDSIMNEKMDTAHLRSYIADNVESWEAIGERTVQFRMKQPYFDAVGICGNLVTIIPKHVYGDYDAETWSKDLQDVCRGSGPFILEEWKKNEAIILVRNENYWGPKPSIDRMTIRIIQNDLPALQEFKAENVDVFAPTGEQWIANKDSEWVRDRSVTTRQYYTPRGGYLYIGYNLRKPHFADKRTRQALTMLIDRQAFIDSVYEGQGRIITGPFFILSDQYDKTIEPWPFDPERAQSLLREVGWEDTDGDGIIDKDLDGDGKRDPFEVTYLVPSGGSTGEKIQRFVQEAFLVGGIKVNLDQLEWSVFLERVDTRQYDMVTLSWTGSPESDPHQIWHSDSEPNRGSNHVGFINEEADRAIERARGELDYDTRMALWHKFHRILHEEQPYTFITARPARYFAHERFRNVMPRDYRPYFPEWYAPAAEQLR